MYYYYYIIITNSKYYWCIIIIVIKTNDVINVDKILFNYHDSITNISPLPL